MDSDQSQKKDFSSRAKEREKNLDYEQVVDSGFAEFVNSIPEKIVNVTVRDRREKE